MNNPDTSASSRTGVAKVTSHSSRISFTCGGTPYKPSGGSGAPVGGFHIDPVSVVLLLALCCLFSRNKTTWRIGRTVSVLVAVIIGVRMLFIC